MKNATVTTAHFVDEAPTGYRWCVTEAAKAAVIERLSQVLHEKVWVEGYLEAAEEERFGREDWGARASFEIERYNSWHGNIVEFDYFSDEVVLRLIFHPENIRDSRNDGELAARILVGGEPDFGGVRAELQATFEASGSANFDDFSSNKSDAINLLLDKYEALYKEAWEAERAIKVVF
jgi:hypothetical protein